MNKRSLALLEQAFAAEVNGAIEGGIGLFQTRSKLAMTLVNDGYLAPDVVRLGGTFPVRLEGFRLTELGRLAYCLSCDLPPPTALSEADKEMP